MAARLASASTESTKASEVGSTVSESSKTEELQIPSREDRMADSAVAERDRSVVVGAESQAGPLTIAAENAPRTLPRVGSAVVIRQGDTLLLAQRAKDPNRGTWVFPGGKIEPFESIHQAAEREILEETGLHIEVGEQIGAFEIIRPPDEHRVIIYSWAHPVAGTPRAASDVSDLRFCTREELFELDLSEIVAHVTRSIGWLSQSNVLAA
jgi:8-oxo-dGTP diphosphatase